MGVNDMIQAARAIAQADTGYNQSDRWSFFNRDTKRLIPGKAGDCATVCGAIASLGGYRVDLADPFWTGTFKRRLIAAGFTAIRFTGLDQVQPGDFVLNEKWHVEFVTQLGQFFSATSDENGGITGGKPGNQNGRETRFTPAYIYRHGWDWILRPPTEKGDLMWSGKMASPIVGTVSCEWRGYTGHAGIDIAAPTGTPVYAAYAGTVEKAGTAVVAGRSGKGIVVRNADREAQYYGHLNSISVAVGQLVAQGQLIGYSGATGNVTGPHLHFETWIKNGSGMVDQDTNPREHFNAHGVVPGSTTGQKQASTGRSFYTRSIDGEFGIHSVKSLQLFLTTEGFYDREIDGQWGAETNRAVQKWLTAEGFYDREIDGQWGTETGTALQGFLTSRGHYDRAIDGDWGFYTRKALQSYLAKGA